MVLVDAIVAVGVVGSLAGEVLATGAALVVGVAAGVLLGWPEVVGALEVVVLGVLLPDELPPNGSVYCWSPAEPPPEARVAAGTASAMAPSTSMQAMSQRGVRTHASMATAMATRTVRPQTAVLQDLLQDEELCRCRRRVLLGWSPPYPQPLLFRCSGALS